MKKLLLSITVLLSCAFLNGETFVIGIAGGSGSGKSTIAKELKSLFGKDAVIIEQDSYYKDISDQPIEKRAATNFDEPAAIDESLFLEHLLAIKSGQTVDVPIYDYSIHGRVEQTRLIEPHKIVIVEGILLFAMDKILPHIDLKVFVECSEDVRLLRRIERDLIERGRDLSSIKKQYLSTVKPMHDLHVEPSKKKADIIIQNEQTIERALYGLQYLLSNNHVNSSLRETEEKV